MLIVSSSLKTDGLASEGLEVSRRKRSEGRQQVDLIGKWKSQGK